MKKTKLITTIMTICLAVCTLAYGVYATTNLSFTIGANIGFEVQNLFVQVNGSVNGAYSDSLAEQTALTINNYEIVHYDPTVVVSTINPWNIGNIYFSNSNVNQAIEFVFTVVNHTPNTTISVDITPDATTATAFSNAELIITKTYTANKQSAANGETIVLKYSLKLPNLTNAVNINAINLNVAIDRLNTMNLSLNEGTGSPASISYMGATIQTAPTSPTKSGFNFVGWCSDSTLINQITFPYTVTQGVTTLYAKWEEIGNYDFRANVVKNGNVITWTNPSTNLTAPQASSALYWSCVDNGTNCTLIDIAASNQAISNDSPKKLVTWYSDTDCTCLVDYEEADLPSAIYGKKSQYNILENDTIAQHAAYYHDAGRLGGFEDEYQTVKDLSISQENYCLPAYVYKDISSKRLTTITSCYQEADAGSYSIFLGTNIELPSTITTLGASTFKETSFKTITIPNSVTSIGDYAFNSCSLLTSITIPNSVTSIGSGLFYYCESLTSITIPDSVTSIGSSAFSYCSKLVRIKNLSNVTLTEGTHYRSNPILEIGNGTNFTWTLYEEDDCIMYSNSNSSIVWCMGASNVNATNITIPQSCTGIYRYAFYGCTSLTSIEIPSSVTSIGDYAFYDCNKLVRIKNLPNVTLTEGTHYRSNPILEVGNGTNFTWTLYEEDDCIMYSNSSSSIVWCMGTSNVNATNIIIPQGCTAIYKNAFYNCTSLTSIAIPNSVTSIENYAFQYCTSLSSVTIGNNVTSIGYNSFWGTSYYKNSSNWTGDVLYLIASDGETKYLIEAKESISGAYTILANTKVIATSALSSCRSLTSITIPDSVTSISSNAFQYCTNLTSATFEDTSNWCVYSDLVYTQGETSISNTYLGNTSTAATYLKTTYCDKYWKKG